MAISLEPFPNLIKYDWDKPELVAWFHRLFFKTGLPGGFLFNDLDFTGSNLSSIETTNHDDLDNRRDIAGVALSSGTQARHFSPQQFQDSQVHLWLHIHT